ncbi:MULTISPECIES: energy transducer TonB [Kordiimonas]|uniref:energy transducer TonB n=1 Tax=Kordiimonas TaxID=288021 RepID=UPI00257F5E56|nr:TonB family protein [Kordiimonas sp. UBA4487]
MSPTSTRTIFTLGLFAFLCGTTVPSATAQDYDLATWGERVYDAFASKQRYPKRALDAKLEGTVKVEVTVGQNGDIIGFRINQSSGHNVLDGSVLQILNRINPLPPLPEGLSSFNFKIPLRFNMDEQQTQLGADVQVAEATPDWQGWQRDVSRILARNQGYPTQLIEEGIEGTVRVKVQIAMDGTILAQQVVESSGNPILDDEAVDLMRRISFPKLPENRESVSLTIPLSYKINAKG